MMKVNSSYKIKEVKLSPHQKKAYEKLRAYKVGALFMEPGTGKTLTAIKLINSSDADFLAFLTPCQNKKNIKAELEKWGVDVPYKIWGIETFSSSDREYMNAMNILSSKEKPFMVVDESLKIKNSLAKRTSRIVRLGKLCEYRLILNGTPLSKNIIDVYSQMMFLSPKILNMDFYKFYDTFIEYITYKRINTRNITVCTGYSNLEYLYSLISPFVYDSKLSITPEKTYKTLNYSVDENLAEYQEIKSYYLSNFMDDPNVFLPMTQQMQQSYCCEESKFDIVKQYVTPKTIIFCKFIKSQIALQERFPDTLVMTYGKGSLGLNMQNYNRIIFFDKTFNYAQREQAERRIYRMGQNDNCSFISLTGDVGLESFIDKNISNKTDLLDAFKKAVIENHTEALINEF